MPSSSSPHTLSRRRFLRTAGATAGTGLSAATAGCSTRTLFSGVNVHFRTQALESPPVGLVNTGSWLVATGMDGEVVGMDRGDGEVQWENDAVDEVHTAPVGHDGFVYLAAEDLVSVDDATTRWRTALPTVATALTVSHDNDVVAVGTADGHVIALNADDSTFIDADDGDRLWQARLTVEGTPARVDAVAAGGGVVYAGSRAGVAVALDAATGEVRWRTDTAVSAIASNGSTTLLGRERVSSVRDGDVQWSVDTGNNWTTDISSTGWWYLMGTRSDGDGYLTSLTHDGERRWRHRLTGDGVALTPVVNGTFFVGVEGERPGVHQFTTEGESLWFFETETSVVDVCHSGDWAWVVTANGEVIALSQ